MSGMYFYPLKRVFLNLSGGTVTGDTVFTQGVFANALSGGTIYSGATLLDIIIQNIASNVVSSSASTLATYVQPGNNISTGGTALMPIVNVVDSPSFNNLFSSGNSQFNSFIATSISGGTILSGNTDLYNIFQILGTDINTAIQPGVNIITGGTALNPIISIVSSPSFNGLSFSGNAIGNTLNVITISGGTIYSGTTDIYTIFAKPGLVVNNVNAGSNIVTGGTAISPTINLTASPFVNNITFSGTGTGNVLSVINFSGGTISSGATNLYNIFLAENDELNGGSF